MIALIHDNQIKLILKSTEEIKPSTRGFIVWDGEYGATVTTVPCKDYSVSLLSPDHLNVAVDINYYDDEIHFLLKPFVVPNNVFTAPVVEREIRCVEV